MIPPGKDPKPLPPNKVCRVCGVLAQFVVQATMSDASYCIALCKRCMDELIVLDKK